MGELKYGRNFKLSNGETEYIEISERVEESYRRDYVIVALKRKVEEYHCQTEEAISVSKSFQQNRVKTSIVKRWGRAITKSIFWVLIALVAGCAFTSLPVWLQIIGCVAGAIYLAYTFSKE